MLAIEIAFLQGLGHFPDPTSERRSGGIPDSLPSDGDGNSTARGCGQATEDSEPQAPASFAARLVTGGLCGAAYGAAGPSRIGGLLAGVVGSVVGTLGGYEFRAQLEQAIGGNDLPIALLEDVIAIGGALLIATR